jgi:hypothetical protein
MNRIFVFLLLILSATAGRTDILGGEISLSPPPGWKSVTPFQPLLSPSPHATLKYIPTDGRHALLVITLLPPDVLGFEVKDRISLERFNRIAAEPFLSGRIAPPQPVELELPDCLATCLTTDYSGPGLPATPEPYRLATTASLLVGRNHLVHVAIFHDGRDAPEYRQALQALQSLRHRGNEVARTKQHSVTLAQASDSGR